MATLDFSANRCYPLHMPNPRSEDLRERLDRRVGASTCLSKSRMFVYGGCVLGMVLNSDFSFMDIKPAFELQLPVVDGPVKYRDYLSSECFTLSLIRGKWIHYKAEDLANTPQPRMFHSSTVHDNYIYIRGGVTFNDDNELVMLNDVWSFDTIDRKWHCFFQDGNDKVPYRFKDITVYIPSLSIIGRPTHNGIMGIGGVDKDNVPDENIFFFDLFDGGLTTIKNGSLKLRSGEEIFLTNTNDAIQAVECDVNLDLKFLLFHKSDDPKNFQPLFTISNDLRVDTLKLTPGSNADTISNLENPTLGKFGKNFVVTGFEKDMNRISSFVYNYTSNLWTKLQISCIHKVFTHKLSMGYVWESHHKIIFLGSSFSKTNEPQSIQFFDTMLVLALPFTNILASNVEILSKFSPRSSVALSRSSSYRSDSANIPQLQSTPQLPLPHPPISQPHTTINQGFEEYSNHVAQQIQVNSIQSVLPPYAIAIGKGAFHRTDALSDMSFLCADGSIIAGNMTLCRRRWGAAFDLLMTDAYAKSLAEAKVSETTSGFYSVSEKSSIHFDSVSNKSKSSDSNNNNNNNNIPHFRYPFKDNESSSSNNNSSPIDNESSQNSSRRNSRRKMSLPYLTPNPAAHRASLSISQSRRNSHNVGSPSRNNSISVPSRRNSLNLIQQFQSSSSRRGSTLSKSSIVSGTSTSSIQSPNLKPNCDSSGPNSELNTMTPLHQPALSITPTPPAVERHNDNENVYVQSLPPALPMPTVLPNGKPVTDDSFDPFDPNGDTTLDSGATHTDFNPSTPTPSSNFNSGDMSMNSHSTVNAISVFDEENNFHFGKLPRVLYLPFSKSTVQALNEYLYSGQIGASWKIFPTVTELLIVSKRLGVALLYDLLLEIVFVVLGLVETELNDGIKIEGFKRGQDIKTCDHGGRDDYEVYCQLLCEISNDIRRTSGSTLDSGIIRANESILSHDALMEKSIMEDDDLGPTDSGLSPKGRNDSETGSGAGDDDDISILAMADLKNTLSVLDESGYYSSADNLNDDDNASDEDHFGGKFKKFTIGGDNLRKEDDGGNDNDDQKYKEWPTVKDTLNTPVKTWLSKTLLDMAIEVGTLINDSHLLVRAMHVRELYFKLQDLKAQHIAGEEDEDNNDIVVDEDPKSAAIVDPSVETIIPPTVPRRKSQAVTVPSMTPFSSSSVNSQVSTGLIPSSSVGSVGSKNMKPTKSSIRTVMSSILPREVTPVEPEESVAMHPSPSQLSFAQKKAKTIFGRFKRNTSSN